MVWNKVTFLIPYLFALAITTSVFVFAWRHRHIRGGNAYTWYVAGQTLWAVGYVFELLVPGLKGKIFWDSVQWVAGFFIVIAFPFFAVRYTSYKINKPGLVWGLAAVVPVIMTALVITDSWHHLIYPNPYLSFDTIYPELRYGFTWVVYGYAIYSCLVTLTGLGLLVRRMFRPHRLYARQVMTVALGFFIPIFFSVLTTAGVDFTPFRDVSILTFSLGNLIIATGLFRYRLFEVVPIARELVVESMEDLVVVLDMQDRIVDINPTATQTLEMKSSQLIGQPAATVFATWPELVKRFFKPENVKSEISIASNHFEIKSTLLYDKNDRYVGRVFVARDITERKELQKELEELNQELEKRVAKRTEELRKSAESYLAVVENQNEFIVQWNIDGTGTFVNDAYCRYFGLTQEEAQKTHFASLVDEKERPALEDKTVRLWSGTIDSETNVYHVKKPDGGFGYHEWVDQVIRDKSGNVVEIQSVGRDITEAKQAELALQRTENLYQRAINAAGAVPYVIRHDAHGYKFVFISENIIQLTGYSDSEMTQEIWESAIQESFPRGKLSHLTYDEADQITNEDHSLLWECDFRIHTRDGKTRWISDTSVKGLDEKGENIISIGIYQDITERKRAEKKLAEAYDTTLEGWAKALELRDKETEDHSRRVVELTITLAKAMGIEGDELTHIRRGAILHDIGKMGIPDEILRKRGKLTISERKIVEQHPAHSYALLSHIPYLEKALDVPYCHHEHWDGSGYPRGLKGEEIPLAARIFSVVDVWDAITSDRPYSKAWSKKKAIQYLKDESGKYFDPNCVSVFLELVEQGKI